MEDARRSGADQDLGPRERDHVKNETLSGASTQTPICRIFGHGSDSQSTCLRVGYVLTEPAAHAQERAGPSINRVISLRDELRGSRRRWTIAQTGSYESADRVSVEAQNLKPHLVLVIP